MSEQNPEIGQSVQTGDIVTNYHDIGEGAPVLLFHGSGPGVSAWANWRLLIAALSPKFRVLAPDFAGFGYSRVPDGITYSRQVWLDQMIAFMDALGIEKASVVGNSFGGSMALSLAIHHPERVDKVILMGAAGVPFELTEGLDRVWGYEPSLETMDDLMRSTFAYDSSLITDDLVRMRYEASVRPGAQEAFSAMFPAPRQQGVDGLAHTEAEVRTIGHRTLIVHGRDDKVIPLSNSTTLLDWIDDSQLHVFGHCGHWTQIEKAAPFAALVGDFLQGRV
ncbi:alpha/beta fold hydrolase [Raineyella fluvialis]|uniref:Alpha/beta fold hydrolase n=1 Tax=Raineyella fluvialis TaxID=2662261 RepID=A0A5Q2FGQ1_9ACTN|nr:alpha/beta fold hydrolase [Raineyella fluvialis]QGF24967.1 alpha/beta fold hydrolase [Raineyella fluvialis]